MLDLNGKNVCLFCTPFFGYDIDIKKEIESFGANVELYDERIYSNTIWKIFVRLNFKPLKKIILKRKFESILLNNKVKFDYILLVSPETVDLSILKEYKKKNKDVKIITYMWDSLKNKRSAISYSHISDSIFSFDKNDVNKYNFNFLPLFYNYKCKTVNKKIRYQCSFIGTIHSNRYNIVNNIIDKNNENFTFYYSPSFFVFTLKRFFLFKTQSVPMNEISFLPMNYDDVVDVIGASNVVIDIAHKKQSGLTMRTIETLGAKRKLITTNKNVLEYDFYHKNNIYIYSTNGENRDLKLFLDTPYFELNKAVYDKYSINTWVKNLFL